MKITRKVKWGIGLGLIPALLIYIGFAIVPIIISFYYSLVKWDGFSPMHFVGLANFKRLIHDGLFWNSLKNNVYIIIASVVGQLVLALFFALILNTKIKGAKFFRTVGFLPVVSFFSCCLLLGALFLILPMVCLIPFYVILIRFHG